MALVVNITHRDAWGEAYVRIGTLAFDSSYPTGGEAYTLAQLGFSDHVKRIDVDSNSGYVFAHDTTNKKILAYRTKDPGAVGGADVVLQQVADTTDLSALTAVPFMAVGI